MIMVRCAMGVSLLERRRNEEILDDARLKLIAMANEMRKRRLEWFVQVKSRDESEKHPISCGNEDGGEVP